MEQGVLCSSWADTPDDILCDIYSRLVAGERVMFRATCRSWSLLNESMDTQRYQFPTCPSTCLLFSNNKVFLPIYDRQCRVDFHCKPDLTLHMAKSGWFLGKKNFLDRMAFVNLFTEEEVILPDIGTVDNRHMISTMYFSLPPTSADWLVIAGVNDSRQFDDICVYTIKRRDESWSCCRHRTNDFIFSCCNPVVYKGLYFFLGTDAKLLIHDPKSRRFYFHEAPKSVSHITCYSDCEQYMLETDGRILAVFVGCNGSLIITLQWNFSTEMWEIVESLGDKMLFVSRMFSSCVSATTMGTSNKIYFPRFIGSNGLFYSLSTKRFHTFEMGASSYESFIGSKFHPHAWWVQQVGGCTPLDVPVSPYAKFYGKLRYALITQKVEGMPEEASPTEQDMISVPPKLLHPYPWLVIFDEKRTEHQTFYNIIENQNHVCAVLELWNKFIFGCNREWLILADITTRVCSVLNILTMEEVHLPPFNLLDWEYSRCVLSLKEDGSWRALFFTGAYVISCNPGDSEVVIQEPLAYTNAIICAISLGEDLYVMNGYDLYWSDLSDHDLDYVLLVDGNSLREMLGGGNLSKNYLVESCGQLLFIIITYFEKQVNAYISIFRADLGDGKWVKLDGLGDQVIFLNEVSSSGYSYPAAALGLKANTVYYVQMGCSNVFVYDVQDENVSVSLPCPATSFNSYLSWLFIPNKN